MGLEDSLMNLFLQTIRALDPSERTLYQSFVSPRAGELPLKNIPSRCSLRTSLMRLPDVHPDKPDPSA